MMYMDSSKSHTASEVSIRGRSSRENGLLHDQSQDVETPHIAFIPKRTPGNLAPLSFTQQHMWLLAQSIPQIPVYNETIMIHLSGPLDVSLLEQSLNGIIERHALWRTSFPLVNGQPVQMTHPAWKVELPTADVRDLPEKEREEKVLQLTTALAQTPFDLTTLPLLRALLFQLDEEKYYLCMVIHHIIFDVHTLHQVFLSELHALYQAFMNGQPSSLPPLSFEYADFAAWQQEQLHCNALEDQQAYWKIQLANAQASLELPTDRPSLPTPSYRGSRVPFTLSKEVANGLKLLSDHEEVKLDAILIAALMTLLHRYTAQDDIIIGATSRKNLETQGPLGVFLTTFPLRVDLASNPTFHELVGRVHKVVLEAQEHQDVSFGSLVKALNAEQSGRPSTIQVMFSLEPASPILPSGWTITRPNVGMNIATSDLYVVLHDQLDGLAGWFEYNTDVFDVSTVKRMLQHWEVLLRGIVRDHRLHLSQLPILTEEEHHQLVVEWNNTRRSYPDDQCIHQVFDTQAERTPNAPALIFADQQLTYCELNAKSNQLAHYLRRSGVGPEVPVGICMERSPEMIVATLGVLKAGGAYVPLDPQYPRERQIFLLQDAQPLLILTHKQCFSTLPEYPSEVINLDSEWKVIDQESSVQLINQADVTNLAYIIYTSGSTGRPKGVLVTHQNLVNSTCARITYHEPIKRLLLLSPFVFDASVGSIFGTLCQGGTLVLPEAGAELEITSLINLIVQHQVTHFVWAPVLYALVLENATARQLSSLREVTVGGEPCTRTLVERHYELLPHAPLFNEYGPTEGTVWSTVYRCQPQMSKTTAPIGRPIANVQIYLLDTYLQPVPIGVAGELYIGGANVARGYLNRPDLTAERFISNPFSQEAGGWLYKTGDVACYLPTGDIEFLGRADQQVKIRGFRIELDEIKEVILKQLPEVREAVVMVREVAPGDQRLVSYLVPVPETHLIPSTIRKKLTAYLPDYMIPGTFMLLDKLPLSTTGKIDYAALSALGTTNREVEETFVAPTQIIHYQLLNIWEELLETRPIGIRDNFFMLGGHSLLAARLVAHIEQVFGKKIALSTLFAGPTIEQLADVLQKQENPNSSLPLIAVQTGGSKRPFFFLHGNWKGEAFYCFRLARAMGSDQPFYALGTLDFSKEKTLPTVERMAASYIGLLRSIQPEGPYLLGGYCNGGMLAYEMAQQLHAQGEQIDLLALINPSTAESDAFKSFLPLINGIGTLLHMDRGAKGDFFLRMRHMVRHVYRNLFPFDHQLRDFPKLIAIDSRLKRMFPAVDALHKDYISILSWIVPDYKPGYSSGKVTYFWPREELFLKDIWNKVSQAREVEEFMLPGTHLTVISEHVDALAEDLNKCIAKAQSKKIDYQDVHQYISQE